MGLGGVLYLIHIHRLFDAGKRRKSQGAAFGWMNPAAAKASAPDTGAALCEQITSRERIMVLNDEVPPGLGMPMATGSPSTPRICSCKRGAGQCFLIETRG